MITVRFICKNCGERFTVQVFDTGEAEAKRMPTAPVQCPTCGSTQIVRH